MEFKIKIQDEAHSKKVQEYLFEQGCEWALDIGARVINTDMPWLFVEDNTITTCDVVAFGEQYEALDLSSLPEFQPAKKIVSYLNVYKNEMPIKTREEADNLAGSLNRIACIRVEFEEGRFDD